MMQTTNANDSTLLDSAIGPITDVVENGGGSANCRSPVDTAEIQQAQQDVRSSKIMIVDDEDLVIRVVRRFLASDGYSNFVALTDPREAIEAIQREQPDVVLLDIMMPHITGLELLKVRQQSAELFSIPFVILSANSENQTKRDALKLGATDFLSKPVDPNDLVLRVQNSLMVKKHHDHLANYAIDLEKQVAERTEQIEKSREQVVHCLARAAEYRDNETGQHIIRVGKYASIIAQQLGFGTDYCSQIELAAQLHDVGKIGIPDAVLLNPGKLTIGEFDIMKTHCQFGTEIMEPLALGESEQIKRHAVGGASILDGVDSPMLEMAAVIARTHHEKWDGTGYPGNLKGEAIPVEGRIVCIADVYDALCSERPYKPRFPLQKCLEIMISERGTRFDPTVLDAFLARMAEVESVRMQFDDLPVHATEPSVESVV